MTLESYFRQHPKAAVAFSGGTDSAWLLYAAKHYAKEVEAWYFCTPFQFSQEQKDASELCRQLGVKLHVIEEDILQCPQVVENDEQRCYYCKRRMFERLKEVCAEKGFYEVMEGTNASDRPEGRPGYRALKELGILSPLRECGLTKDQIRLLSARAGLFTASKPSNSCLATRIPTGIRITRSKLQKVAACEQAMRNLGFSNFRVRIIGESGNETAKIEAPEDQIGRIADRHRQICSAFAGCVKQVVLELNPRKGAD